MHRFFNQNYIFLRKYGKRIDDGTGNSTRKYPKQVDNAIS